MTHVTALGVITLAMHQRAACGTCTILVAIADVLGSCNADLNSGSPSAMLDFVHAQCFLEYNIVGNVAFQLCWSCLSRCAQGMLLVWMHVALHGLLPLSSSSRQGSREQELATAGPLAEGWRNAAGVLAGQGTPHTVLAASRLGSAEANAGQPMIMMVLAVPALHCHPCCKQLGEQVTLASICSASVTDSCRLLSTQVHVLLRASHTAGSHGKLKLGHAG